ncbi:BamA/TamA family outer membrane protein [Pleurocapsa sp. PCC 7319]|uniref:BamA/TamA family outer membrane protein n=1 Tax=Pleurocapsa sp. PCC 7319 TaxID=118161 RepID=UPI000345D648|nr:BamA/TamA family outer membrane protein [Pleurocapsa sp. PCC 7319]
MSSNLILKLCQFLTSQRYSTFGFSLISIYLALATASWGQKIPIAAISEQQAKLAQVFNQNLNSDDPDTIPLGNEQTIDEIQVNFVDRNNQPVTGKTKPNIIIQEFELKPGDVYDPELAQKGLDRVNDLFIIKRGTLDLKPSTTNNNVVMVVTVEESNPFFLRFGLTLPPPTALQGAARTVTVIPQSHRANGISGGVRLGLLNLGGTNKTISLGVEGGADTLGLDLEYRDFWRHDRGYAVNIFNRQTVEPEFENGDTELNLPDGEGDPWIERFGGGVEYFFPFSEDFEGALGVSYQKVSARDGIFSDSLEPVDENGNQLTFSDNGRDDLLTINFASVLDRRNSTSNPTLGYRLLFGMDQSIPIGDASILYNRLTANYTQFLPLNLFGFTEGDRTLVLNFQGGTVIGDLPPYEGFSLGGSSSVRGFTGGEVGTGRSFVQATAEYRFPMFKFDAFSNKFDVGGTLFVDYGTDLDSADSVKGRPAEVRDKPGSAFGYGLGLRVLTRYGTVRLEFALNDDGGSAFHFNIGERF